MKWATSCSQWTGTEYKHIEKVFLGVLAGGIDSEVACAVCGLLDFIYYVHLEVHTTESLGNLQAVWQTFHDAKGIFVKLGVHNHFNFAKLHSMEHYIQSIMWLGAADGYNTEGTERLHIDFAKQGYQASNRKQYISQMTMWLERREAIHRFEGYLQWLKVDVKHLGDSDLLEDPAEESVDESDDENDTDGEEQDTHMEMLPPSFLLTRSTSNLARKDTQHTLSPTACTFAKNPAFPNIPISKAAETFGTPNLTFALTKFLKNVDTTRPSGTTVQASSIPQHVTVSEEMHISAYNIWKNPMC